MAMHEKTEYTLGCDFCHERGPTLSDDEEAQMAAEDLGWRYTGGAWVGYEGSVDFLHKDFCPMCYKRYSKECTKSYALPFN